MSYELARKALGEKAILDAATELNIHTRDLLAQLMSRGSKITVFADDAETVDLGQVWVTNPKPAWKVTDQAAFLAWVAEHHPDAIVTQVTVSPAWTAALLKKGADADGVEPDGITLVSGKPSLTVRPSDHAKALARSLVVRELE